MKYTGGCHCGAVRYEAELDLGGAIECNCSHCSMKGLILVFTPAIQFTLLTPDAVQTEYLFNKKKIQHLFCPICGVQAYAQAQYEGKDTRAVNIRTIDSIDLTTIHPKQVNGKEF